MDASARCRTRCGTGGGCDERDGHRTRDEVPCAACRCEHPYWCSEGDFPGVTDVKRPKGDQSDDHAADGEEYSGNAECCSDEFEVAPVVRGHPARRVAEVRGGLKRWPSEAVRSTQTPDSSKACSPMAGAETINALAAQHIALHYRIFSGLA